MQSNLSPLSQAKSQSRKSYIGESNNVDWDMIDSSCGVYTRQFFLNVKYLLSERKETITSMRNNIYTIYKFRIGIDAVQRYIRGVHRSCHLSYLQVYCLYFNEKLTDMLFTDYKTERKGK